MQIVGRSNMPPEELREIPTDRLDDPLFVLHPSESLEELESLYRSMHDHFQIDPIVVRPRGDRFEILSGHRRVMAARKFGMQKILARVVSCDDQGAVMTSLVANVQRVQHDVIEEAKAIAELVTRHSIDQKEIARRLGRSISYVEDRMDLLSLTSDIQELARSGRLQLGVASYLKRIPTEEDQILVGTDIVRRGYTTEEAKRLIDNFLKYKKEMLTAPKEKILEKAAEEPSMACTWCHQDRQVRFFRQLAICDECYRGLMFLSEQERRAERGQIQVSPSPAPP